MKINANKILLGNSIPLEEEDINEDQNIFNISNDVYDEDDKNVINEMTTIIDYYVAVILNSIGTDKFKMNYKLFSREIKTQCNIKTQRKICFKIMEKIEDIYGFIFPEKLDLLSKEDLLFFYEFLEFLEYDNEEFITNIWLYLDTDLSNQSIKHYCINNEDMIIREIEDKIDIEEYSKNISIFLRTYEKTKMIKWFITNSINYKNLILLNIYNSDKK